MRQRHPKTAQNAAMAGVIFALVAALVAAATLNYWALMGDWLLVGVNLVLFSYWRKIRRAKG